MRPRRRLATATAIGVLALCGAARAASLPAPPTNFPAPPSGKKTSCTTTGPQWVAGPGHGETEGPTRVGTQYTIHAWGLTCSHARDLLRAFFPKMPAHPMGKLRGGPKGYSCKAVAEPGTRSITNLHDGSCIRLDPAATFDWGPKGRGRPGPYMRLK